MEIKFRNMTVAILVAVIFCLIIWDICALFFGGLNSTISVVLYTSAKSEPIISFGLGVLCGHWFWPIGGAKDE